MAGSGDDQVSHAEGEPSQSGWMNVVRSMIEEVLNQRKTQEEPPVSNPNTQPEKENESRGSDKLIMQKLSRFKKFAPPSFKEAQTPVEAEEWLNQLGKILDLIQAEENDKMIFVEFLLEGEAMNWWNMEKRRLDKEKATWDTLQKIFLRHYFSKSVCDQKGEFMSLK